jgi:hypothetical protein
MKATKNPIFSKVKTEGKIFIPSGSELIDFLGNVHTTNEDQTITIKNFGIKTNLGIFIPKAFVYANINS